MNCTEEFIAKMKQKDIVINFVQAWRNDTLEESYARLDKPTRLHAYSISKSVTSIGVGLAVQEGLLRLDDRVLRFYPEYDPAELAPNLRRMTVRDLLMMGCGSKDKMFFWNDAQRLQCRDWQDYFLRNEFPYASGSSCCTTVAGTASSFWTPHICMRQKKTSTRSMPPSTATAISSGRTRTTNPTAQTVCMVSTSWWCPRAKRWSRCRRWTVKNSSTMCGRSW